jgi:sortase A
MVLRIAERSLLAAGMILISAYLFAFLDEFIASRLAIRHFESAVAMRSEAGAMIRPKRELVLSGTTGYLSFWAPERITGFRASLLKQSSVPLGVLRVEKLGLLVPVFEGTSARNLNRGVGWIVGTAKPGHRGNIGIAGHRDSFFRRLQSLSVGDSIDLSTVEGTTTYSVDQIEIVEPEDVSVLNSGQKSSLTLVTCYPFYFTGSAPQRFIVHAELRRQARDE